MSLNGAISISAWTDAGIPGESGSSVREVGRVGGPHAHKRVVVHAVEAALELENLVAAAERPGGPHGVVRRLRSAAEEAHLAGAGHRGGDLLGQQHGQLVQGKEGKAPGSLLLHGLNHLGVRVPYEHRARPQQVVRRTRCRSGPIPGCPCPRARPSRSTRCPGCRPAAQHRRAPGHPSPCAVDSLAGTLHSLKSIAALGASRDYIRAIRDQAPRSTVDVGAEEGTRSGPSRREQYRDTMRPALLDPLISEWACRMANVIAQPWQAAEELFQIFFWALPCSQG